MKPCACGCGQLVARRFVRGHASRMQYVKDAVRAGIQATDFEEAWGTRKRNDEIRDRLERGESFTDLAAEYGVSRQRVEQIYRKARHLARVTVRNALDRGELVRPDACERCGQAGPVDSHHPDYGRPLDIEWLCRPCHTDADLERRQRRGEQRRTGTGPRLRRRFTLAAARQAGLDRERRVRKEARVEGMEQRRARLLRDLAEVAIAVGHSPTQRELNDRLLYSHVNFHQAFGSLANAHRLAGLIPNSVGGSFRYEPLPPNYARIAARLRGDARNAA